MKLNCPKCAALRAVINEKGVAVCLNCNHREPWQKASDRALAQRVARL